MKPRFSLPFQLFSERLFWDSERQIPHSGKSITFTPIWIRDHWWSNPPSFSSLRVLLKHRDFFFLFIIYLKEMTAFVWIPAGCFGTEWKCCTQRGSAACGWKSRDTEGICTVKGVRPNKVGQLTHSIAGRFWCHPDIISSDPHPPYTQRKKKTFTSVWVMLQHRVVNQYSCGVTGKDDKLVSVRHIHNFILLFPPVSYLKRQFIRTVVSLKWN